MSRPAFVRLALALLAAAALAHVAYWYLPRARTAEPRLPEARELLGEPAAGSEEWQAVLWIAYPHQNLGQLEGRLEEPDAWLGTILAAEGGDRSARSTQRRADVIPKFGPFRVPPARELVVTTRSDGSVRAVVDVYPLVAALARAAGAVAGNPWLAGGAVGSAPDRPGRVSWRGSVWTYEDPGSSARKAGRSPAGIGEGVSPSVPAPPQAAQASSLPSKEAFALLRLARRVEVLPPALYRLVAIEREVRGGSGRLALLAGEPPKARVIAPELLAGAAGFAAPAGWVAERRAPAGAGAGGGVRGFAVWNEGSEVSGLPLLASFRSGGVEGFDLPGEGLFKLVGRDVPEGSVAGFEVRSLESAGVAAGGRLAERLAPLFAAGGEAFAVVRAGELEALLRDIAGYLGAVPFVDPEERRRFERWAGLLVPLRDCGASTLEVGPRGEWVRILPCVPLPSSSTVLPGGRSD